MYDNTESSNKENLDRSAPKTSGSPVQNSASPDQQENSVPSNTGHVDEESLVPENVEDRGAEFESFYVNPEFACGIPIGEIGAALLAWKTKLETIQLSENWLNIVKSRAAVPNCSSRAGGGKPWQ